MRIRLMEIEEPKFPYHFRQSKDAYDALKDYGKADREVFLCLFLNAKNQLIDCEVLSVGAIDSAAVYPREVLKSCILRNASSVIVAHNHPSGDLSPSQADLDITREIMAACLTVQIRLLDHIIIGRESFLSMADAGQIVEMTERVTTALDSLKGGG